jgi:hypothetical protein
MAQLMSSLKTQNMRSAESKILAKKTPRGHQNKQSKCIAQLFVVRVQGKSTKNRSDAEKDQ